MNEAQGEAPSERRGCGRPRLHSTSDRSRRSLTDVCSEFCSSVKPRICRSRGSERPRRPITLRRLCRASVKRRIAGELRRPGVRLHGQRDSDGRHGSSEAPSGAVEPARSTDLDETLRVDVRAQWRGPVNGHCHEEALRLWTRTVDMFTAGVDMGIRT